MTADLELYLRGLYVNRWPCRHVFDYSPIEDAWFCRLCPTVRSAPEVALLGYNKFSTETWR